MMEPLVSATASRSPGQSDFQLTPSHATRTQMPMHHVLFCTAALLLASVALAQTDPEAAGPLGQIVVTATRADQGVPAATLGSSITVIDAKALEQRQVRVVSDVLRDVPGVAVNRSGTVGGLTQVRIRGTEGNHVLVLIDGLEAADPFFNEFDFATLIADEVARVEVLRGQQSALYGSDAIGGVIHYMTASGSEEPGLRVRLESGSFGSWAGSARFAGATDTTDYAVSAGYQTTDGVRTSRFGSREVGAENSVISARLSFAPTANFRLKAVSRFAYTDAEFNDQDFSGTFGVPPFGFVIDSDDHYHNKALYGLVRAEFDSFDDHWSNALSIQGLDASRDNFSDGTRSFSNDGSRIKASYESTLRFGDDFARQTLTAALDFEREETQNTSPRISPAQGIERNIENTGVVVQYDAVIAESLGFGLALRHDGNDRFRDADTYHVQASYRLPTDTRIRAAAGSGVKNPSTSELFGFDPENFIGNPNLKPERSEGWEIGLEQRFANRALLVGITYFDSTLRDEINSNFRPPTFVESPINLATDSTQNGVEIFAATRLGSWTLDAAYTDLNARQNGVEEVRRPPHTGSLSVGWRGQQERLGVTLTVRYNGDTLDSNFTGIGPARVRLEEYTLVNLNADYRMSERVQLFARVENLLGENHEEVFTYRTPGAAGYAGVRLRF